MSRKLELIMAGITFGDSIRPDELGAILDSGDVNLIAEAAEAFNDGLSGAPADPRRAIECWKRAAEMGDEHSLRAIFSLIDADHLAIGMGVDLDANESAAVATTLPNDLEGWARETAQKIGYDPDAKDYIV